MPERSNLITMRGKPLTLAGEPLVIGKALPKFTIVDENLATVTSADLSSTANIISTVPSLDTPVCDVMTRRLQELALQVGDVGMIVVSMDLPFAQKRWCGNSQTDIHLYSDHKNASFGRATGLLIQELRLLARSVIITDPQGRVRYHQLVPEQTEEPNYKDIQVELQAISKAFS